MSAMRIPTKFTVFLLGLVLAGLAPGTRAQAAPGGTGALEFQARITPTGARPEPVRQFTFYLLRKSYAEIAREGDAADPLPTREKFIDGLKVSAKLKEWLKKHEAMDLTSSEIDDMLTADDIIAIPEFLEAYLHSNSGGVTQGLPRPKYKETDKTADPERYKVLREEYLAALHKFITANLQTLGGMEAYLDGVNPARQWNQIRSEHRHRLERRIPELAQTSYLAAKADTDLDGRATLSGLPAGDYWLSTLGLDAAAGDVRLRWDVAVRVDAGQTTHAELSNLNGTEARAAKP
jgi:hypothetical protein